MNIELLERVYEDLKIAFIHEESYTLDLEEITALLDILDTAGLDQKVRSNKRDKSYPETHQIGYISLEKDIERGIKEGDLGVQIAKDGRIWVCMDGQALIRFMPIRNESK